MLSDPTGQLVELRTRVIEIVETYSDIESYPASAELLRDFVDTIDSTDSTAEELAVKGLQIVGIAASLRTDGTEQRIVVHGPQWSFLTPDSKTQAQDTPAKDPVNKSYRQTWPYLRAIIRTEKRDLLFVTLYSGIASLLGLVLPLSSQAIVNSVALGIYTNQLLVLCIVALVALLFMAALAVFERHIVDLIQRRLFVRTAFDIVYRLPLMERSQLGTTYTPELVNRFFDVMTVQKSISKFLIDGINGALVLLTGLILLAVYHPFFLLYDIGLLLFIPILTFILGRGAIPASIKVSKKKYAMAAWLEDVARAQTSIKVLGGNEHARGVADSLSMDYATAKHEQFLIFARQIAGSYVFKAFATVGILALGGLLVIQQQISLGQLVAAEIVVILIIGALEKLINQFDAYYDLSAGVDKLGAITRQPLEEIGGQALHGEGPLRIDITSLKTGAKPFTFEPGSRTTLVDPLGGARTNLMHALAGIKTPSTVNLKVNGQDIRVLDRTSLRSAVGMIMMEDHIVQGTIRDNILLGRQISEADLQWALKMSGLWDHLDALPLGVDTDLASNGEGLTKGMIQLIIVTRMIVHKPRLLIVADGFSGISHDLRVALQQRLIDHDGWTMINLSSEETLIEGSSAVLDMSEIDGGDNL